MAFPHDVDGLIITRDSRAAARGQGKPSKVTVTHRAGSRAEVIRTALASKTVPFALVDSDGHVHILSAGGSGQIWTLGESTDEQDDAVKILTAAMTQAFGIKPEPKKTVKKATKKAAAKKAPATPMAYEGFLSRMREGDEAKAWDNFGVGPDPF